ncbi:MAG: gas vesicle protein K [Bacillota bacterium]
MPETFDAVPVDGNKSSGPIRRLGLEPEKVEQGLARLVLALIDLIRQLMEKQALRRVEAGSLTPDEEEQLGLTLLRLTEKMDELCEVFGLSREDLNLDLGPIGKLY